MIRTLLLYSENNNNLHLYRNLLLIMYTMYSMIVQREFKN